jgi:hypothetical protein
MIKHSISVFLIFCAFFVLTGMTSTSLSTVPEPFRGFDNDSQHTIRYDDLTTLLKTVVVDLGRSNRAAARPAQARTGTRMAPKINRLTATEGNRFYYETFEDNDKAQLLVRGIRDSIAKVPEEIPLENFSRSEQLAYWLNLYNVTLLNEIIAIYPRHDLERVLTGKNSFLSEKLITVAGVPLSLDDIQFRILKPNHNDNPLILYGLYQGIIGGPNIRRSAYTGDDVYRARKNNAIEFINSNCGISGKNQKTFRVSSLYERNRGFFPNFNDDLSMHLLQYLEGSERIALEGTSKLKPGINDWTITDLGETYQKIGRSLAHNNAALLDSMVSTTPAGPESYATDVLYVSVACGPKYMASKGTPFNSTDPALLEQLHVINEKREQTNALNATVTIEELGEVPVDAAPEDRPD